MSVATRSNVTGYLPNDVPARGALISLAFQHVLTMFPATALVAVLTKFDLGVTLFASGFGTIVALLLAYWQSKRFIPLYYGSSFSYIAPVSAMVAANMSGNDPTLGIRLAQGGIVATGVMNILVGFLIKWVGKQRLDKVLPPEITGAVAIVIGISLAGAAISMALGNVVIALITLLATIGFAVYIRRGLISMLPILLGAAVGYAISLFAGLVDFGPVWTTPFLRIPHFTLPLFTWAAAFAIAPIALATIPESTAHLYQISLYVDKLAEDLHRQPIKLSLLIGLNLICDGVDDLINGFLGGCAGTNYGENNSLMAITRNYSGPVLLIAGVIAMCLGFVGTLAALVGTIPVFVTGGLAVFLFGVIGVQGIALMIAEKVNIYSPRSLAVIAVILVVGIGGSALEGGMIPIFGTKLPAIATAAVLGILLNVVFLLFPPPSPEEV